MDIIGKWKLKGMNVPTENGMVLYTAENIPDEFKETFEETSLTVLEFLEGGVYNMIQKVEGELVEAAKAEGMEVRDDGYAVVLGATWEDRDGTVYYDTGAEGTILDEEIDPFEPLQFTEDGCMLCNYGMCLYERA